MDQTPYSGDNERYQQPLSNCLYELGEPCSPSRRLLGFDEDGSEVDFREFGRG